jgi:hypothetical protein
MYSAQSGLCALSCHRAGERQSGAVTVRMSARACEPGQLRRLRLPIGTTNTSGLWAGRIPPGGSREPVGEGGDEVAELVRSLDGERPVERGEQRGQPVEPLRMQLDAEPAFGLRVCAARRRQLLHAPC